MTRRAGTVPRRAASALLWYGLPALALASVAAYIAAALALHVNPPVVPVSGTSMRPLLGAGDLVFLEGVEPSKIHRGEVIAVNVPKEERAKYGLPSRVVHRVIAIEHTSGRLVFQTKGDSNPGPDVFKVHGDEIVGRMTGHVADLGYPLLFFRSTQGKILLGAAALVALLYFAMGLFEERQATVRGTALGLHAVMAQTEEIKQALEGVQTQHPSHPPGQQVSVREPPAQRRDENTELLGKLLVAVGEYGEHLRSHTAVMQGLALATSDLRLATEELRRAAVDSNGRTPQTPQTLDASEPQEVGARAPISTPEPTQAVKPSMPEPAIESRALLLLAVTAAAGVYLRHRAKRTRGARL